MTPPAQYYLIEGKMLEDVAKYAKGTWVGVVRSHPYHNTSAKVLDVIEQFAIDFDVKKYSKDELLKLLGIVICIRTDIHKELRTKEREQR